MQPQPRPRLSRLDRSHQQLYRESPLRLEMHTTGLEAFSSSDCNIERRMGHWSDYPPHAITNLKVLRIRPLAADSRSSGASGPAPYAKLVATSTTEDPPANSPPERYSHRSNRWKRAEQKTCRTDLLEWRQPRTPHARPPPSPNPAPHAPLLEPAAVHSGGPRNSEQRLPSSPADADHQPQHLVWLILNAHST